MVKVKQTITFELESSGQKITVDLQEAKDIIKSLSNFVNAPTKTEQSRRIVRRGRKAGSSSKFSKRGRKAAGKSLSMSETKRQEIIDHVNKQLSARPKTLSALLKGVSFVPNYLPAIRQMVESRGNISREVIGKRIYYSRRGSSVPSQKQSRANTITI